MSKEKIRKKYLRYREKNFKKISINFAFLKKILKEHNYKKNKKVGGYYPINYEINCLEILKKLENAGYEISLPVIKKRNEMDFFQWSFNQPLYTSKFGIPEPSKIKKIYPDIILVPLVAFDKFKYRLGYGGGYYDRYIHKVKKIKKILTIGLAYSFQRMDKIPINKFDKKLDIILTENHIK